MSGLELPPGRHGIPEWLQLSMAELQIRVLRTRTKVTHAIVNSARRKGSRAL